MSRAGRVFQSLVFVLAMAACCAGAGVWIWVWCFLASGGREWRGRYPG